MKKSIEFQEFDGSFHFAWEDGAKIRTKLQEDGGNNQIIIEANKAGLESLANHLLNLAENQTPEHYHLHFDEYNSLEKNSIELVFEKINNL